MEYRLIDPDDPKRNWRIEITEDKVISLKEEPE
jgi:hypothetical protein